MNKNNYNVLCVNKYCYCSIEIPEKSLNSNIKSVMNLDNIKVFRRFVYQGNSKRNLDL
jgi:hypothetical protein